MSIVELMLSGFMSLSAQAYLSDNKLMAISVWLPGITIRPWRWQHYGLRCVLSVKSMHAVVAIQCTGHQLKITGSGLDLERTLGQLPMLRPNDFHCPTPPPRILGICPTPPPSRIGPYRLWSRAQKWLECTLSRLFQANKADITHSLLGVKILDHTVEANSLAWLSNSPPCVNYLLTVWF